MAVPSLERTLFTGWSSNSWMLVVGPHVDTVEVSLGLTIETHPGGEIYGDHANHAVCPLQGLRQRVAGARRACRRSLTGRSSSARTKPGSPTSREAHTPPSASTKPTTIVSRSSEYSRVAGGIVGRMLLPRCSTIGRTLARSCTSISPGWYFALTSRSEEHTSELQSRQYLVCRLLLEKKKHVLPVIGGRDLHVDLDYNPVLVDIVGPAARKADRCEVA